MNTVEHHCSAASVNRKLAALTSFCEFHDRHGVEPAYRHEIKAQSNLQEGRHALARRIFHGPSSIHT
ncbi:hypothetical protein ACOZ38_21010 [Sphaerisporangium viridialbum]|uniref:hypothetical protein n=1 Tax=Sphaerisporangium viridialbum TaxID=46189 RepID=UPI003C7724F7